MPELGAQRIVLSVWFVDVGEKVYEGDRLVEVLIGGATFDVAAPATGHLLEKRAMPNEMLATGQVLGILKEDDGLDNPKEGC